MKTRLTILRLLILLCSTVATTAVFGQTIYVWTNSAATNAALTAAVNLASSTNWDPNGVPSYNGGGVGDEMQWDGRTTGDMFGSVDSIAAGFSGGAYGLTWHLTSNQTHSVQIFTTIVPNNPGARSKEFIVDSGAGAFKLGFDSTTNALDLLMGGSWPQPHGFTNNSATPATIYPNVRWRLGAGGVHYFIFEGTGDWIVNNRLRSQNGASIVVTKQGSGIMTWTATNTPTSFGGDALGTPFTNNGGTLILKSPDCIAGQTIAIVNNALLKYDCPVIPGASLPGTMTGTGTVEVASGQLTLTSGSSTYSGNFNLTGGELIAGGLENPGVSGPLGTSGTISFAGGTLGYSVNNVFDYSGRFSTAPGQAYSVDTAGQNVTFTNTTGLSGAGSTLTKLGAGTLTLAGPSTYTGNTVINVGRLLLQGSKTGTGNIIVADGAILGVTVTGTQVTPNTLTVGTGSGATLEFNNVNSTTIPLIAAGTVSAASTITVNVNSGTFTPGLGYPLFSWSSGSAPGVSLGVLNGYIGNLSTNGSTIQLTVTATAYTWTGKNNGSWDLTTPNNWVQNGGPVVFANGGPALFDDTASGNTSITITGLILPTSVTFNNVNSNYSITSSVGNDIGGGASLALSGGGTVTLSGGANTYTNATTISAGRLSVSTLANGGSASDIGAAANSAANLVLNGGTLQYTGGAASSDHLFTLGTGGGTIDASGTGALSLNKTGPLGYSGNGPRALTLTGLDAGANTLAPNIADNGGATSLTKSGAGLWILTGTNTYSGATTIASGTLQIGAGGPSGSLGSGSIVNNASLDFNRTGSLTVSGAISGSGSVTNDGTGTVILTKNNTYSGGTTINAGTLQVGSGGSTGSLYATGPIVDNSLIIFNTTGSFEYSGTGLISGTGNVIVQGGGVTKAIGNNSYTGWTRIDSGSTFFVSEGLQGTLVSSVVTNNGTLRIVSQDTHFTYPGPIVGSGRVQVGVNNVNPGTSTLTGTNTYTGGTFIGGGTLQLGDGGTPGAGAIVGNVIFTNNFTTADDDARTLTFNRFDDFIFSGNIITNFSSAQSNQGVVQQNGPGKLTLTGTNSYAGGTTINGGTLQVGNGGTSGSTGTGNITDNSVLVFNRSDNVTFTKVISGGGSVVQLGSGTLTLITNSYSGTTTVSNGTLVINGDNFAASTYVYAGTLGGTGTFYGPVTLDPGTTLAPGPSVGSIGTLTINSDLSIGGNLAIEVNKSLSPSNDLVVVSGLLTNTGTGTLTVANLGPALAAGDLFTLFSQPVLNGAALTVAGSGVNWTNNLAVDGSIAVLSFVSRPTLNYTKTGTNLQFSWTGFFKLQAQTNGVGVGIRTNWADYPGGGTSPVTVPIVVTNGSAFFRLAPKP